MPTRSRTKTVLFACTLTLLGTFALLLAAEIAVRIRWAVQHKDPAYLVMGIIRVKSKTTPRAVLVQGPAIGSAVGPINMPTKNGTTQFNPCAGHDIYYRLNSAMGRGPEWPVAKPAGSVRILAIGESSTFGAANAEDQTWPALLEKQLNTAHGVKAEVLNFGIPGQRIDGMIKLVPAVLDKYHPDVVVHYGGFNETWTDPQVPNFLSSLNYRSMLYTYIYEKMYFRAEASALRLMPNTRTYEEDFRRLVSIVREHGASLVVVEQAVAAGASPREGSQCAALWPDAEGLTRCLNDLMSQPDDRYSRLVRSRMFKTVVFQRVLADVANQQHLLVIDPRDSVVQRDTEAHLFCDEIHLTDQGNAILTNAIAGPLAEFIKTQVAGRSGSQPTGR